MAGKIEIARRNIRIQGWVNFLAGLTFLIPVITLLYKFTGLSIFEIVIISNVATFGVFLLELPTSVFADTMGRARSLRISMICNLLGALTILFFFNFWSFILASVFAAFYFSFWSGTGQAFLDENLRATKQSKKFGRIIGHYMFLEQIGILLTPLAASGILFIFGDAGYRILASLDVIMALALVTMTLKLKDLGVKKQLKSIQEAVQQNLEVLTHALKSVFGSAKLRTLLIYRSLSNHVAFFPLLILPILVDLQIPDFYGGLVISAAAVFMLVSTKFAYLIGEKRGYQNTWIASSIIQALLLILVGFFVQNWIVIVCAFLIFNLSEGLWLPAWNHVLVSHTHGKSVATSRSIIFGIFALYTTLGKQILAIFPLWAAFLGLGIFILLVNVILAPKMSKL